MHIWSSWIRRSIRTFETIQIYVIACECSFFNFHTLQSILIFINDGIRIVFENVYSLYLCLCNYRKSTQRIVQLWPITFFISFIHCSHLKNEEVKIIGSEFDWQKSRTTSVHQLYANRDTQMHYFSQNAIFHLRQVLDVYFDICLFCRRNRSIVLFQNNTHEHRFQIIDVSAQWISRMNFD